MSEAIRTCKRCGTQYTGWHCQNPQCRKARANHNASARRSRARRSGGGRKIHSYAAGGFSWNSAATVGPVHADACPQNNDGTSQSSGNFYADEVRDMNHPDW